MDRRNLEVASDWRSEEEMRIDVHKSDKLMHLLLKLGLKEILNSLDFLRERGHTLPIDVMTENDTK